MKPIPDRDWFNRTNLCVILEVSEATFERMLRSGEFPPPDAKRGLQRAWSFESVSDYTTARIDRELDTLSHLAWRNEQSAQQRERRRAFERDKAGNKKALAELDKRRREGGDLEGLLELSQ